MAHFDPNVPPTGTPTQRAAIAHDFLQRCRTWALERELPRRRSAAQTSDDPADAAKLHQWLTWLAFTEHALAEIESGKLDPWFEEDAGS